MHDKYGRPTFSFDASGEVRVGRTDRLGLSFSGARSGQIVSCLEVAAPGTFEWITIESGDVGTDDLTAIGRHHARALTLGWSGHDRHGRRHEKPIRLPGDPAVYKELRSLWGLVVHTGGFDDAQLRKLGSIGQLTVLVLAGTAVTTPTLEMPGLRGLKTAWLSDDETIADSLDFVEALPQLETLGLRNAGLQDRHMRRLAANPGIASLDLGHNRISGATFNELASLNGLWDLDLTGTVLSDAAVARLDVLTRLTRLKLGDTPLGDAAAPHLARLRGVNQLWLTRTYLTDTGLANLVRSMSQIHTLDISMTRVTTDGLRHLRDLPNLLRLEIAPNQLTDEAVEMLADTTTIRAIGIRGPMSNLHLFGHIADTIGAAQILPDA